MTIPAWFLPLVALLSLLPAADRRVDDSSWARVVRWMQRSLLIGAPITAAGVLLVLGMWSLSSALELVKEGGTPAWRNALIASGNAGAVITAFSWTRLSTPQGADRLLWRIGMAIGGYLVLGLVFLVGYYYLWNLVFGGAWRPSLFGEDVTIEWRWVALIASLIVMAITVVPGPWLLNRLSLTASTIGVYAARGHWSAA